MKVESASLDVNSNVGVLSSDVPGGSEVIVVSGAVVSTVKDRLAGGSSTLPAGSLARTSKVCWPSLNNTVVYGERHEANCSVSTRHSNVEPVSSAANANVGVLFLVSPEGPEVIVVCGGVVSGGVTVSTVNERLAGVASVLPAVSIARTPKVCAPSPNSVVVCGELHEANAAPSTRHSNVEPALVEVNSNVGVLSFVVPEGPDVIVVSGGDVSVLPGLTPQDAAPSSPFGLSERFTLLPVPSAFIV
jgi:hypothetical protein